MVHRFVARTAIGCLLLGLVAGSPACIGTSGSRPSSTGDAGTEASDLASPVLDLAQRPSDFAVPVVVDLAMPATQTGCNGLLACVAGCKGVMGCPKTCETAATTSGIKLYRSLLACLDGVCPTGKVDGGGSVDGGAGDGGTDVCAMQNSAGCKACRMAASSSGGACTTEYQDCASDLP